MDIEEHENSRNDRKETNDGCIIEIALASHVLVIISTMDLKQIIATLVYEL